MGRADEARHRERQARSRLARSRRGHQVRTHPRNAVTSRTHRRFWYEFNRLPAHVQCLAREKFQLWLRDPFHPSMQFKQLVGKVWSVRIGDHYRAVAQKHGDLVVWFWIGTHEDYNNFVKQPR